MPKPLTQLQVKNLTPADKPRRYHDGGGLYLNITPNGAKSWVFRFMKHGKATTLGLGRYPDIGLADARLNAAELRKRIHYGFDPVTENRTQAETARAANKKVVTFDRCAEKYIDAHSPKWSNPLPNALRGVVEARLDESGGSLCGATLARAPADPAGACGRAG